MATEYQRFDVAERGLKKNEKMKAMVGAFVVGAALSAFSVWGIMTIANNSNNIQTSSLCATNDVIAPTAAQSDALSVCQKK